MAVRVVVWHRQGNDSAARDVTWWCDSGTEAQARERYCRRGESEAGRAERLETGSTDERAVVQLRREGG